MSGPELPLWVEALTALLLLAGAALTLIGSLGLVRLKTFYARVHAPTLGTTLGAGFIAFASILSFSAQQARPVLSPLLIVAFVLVTTPVSLMILVRAALFREDVERGEDTDSRDRGPAARLPD